MVARYIAFFLGWALPGALFVLTMDARAGNYDQEMAAMAGNVANGLEEQGVRSVAVLDFTDLQGATTELGRFLAEELSTNLVLSKKRFDVIDRANLNRLLDEHKLSRSGLVDPENIKRLGKVAGAHALITGTVTPMGDKLRISAKVISTETAKIVGAARGDIEKTEAIKDLIKNRIVGNTSGSTSRQVSATTPKEKSSNPSKLIHETKEFSATVASAVYDKANNQITVFIDFNNKLDRQRICIAIPEENAVIGIDDTGGTWSLKKVVGLQMVDPELKLDKSRMKRDPFAFGPLGSLVTPGASHRFALVMEPTRTEAGLTLALTVEVLTHSWSTGVPCVNYGSERFDRATLRFDGIAARY